MQTDTHIQRDQISLSCDGGTFEVSVTSGGSGPSVLLLHGWLHSAARWGKLMEALSDSYSFHAVDLPGFGSSPPIHSQNIDLDVYADILQCLCAHISNGRKFHAIVADSLSGILVLKLLQEGIVPSSRIMLSGVPTAGVPFLGKFAAHPKLFYLSLSTLRLLPKKLASRLIAYGAFVTVQRREDVDDAFIEGVLEADPKTAALLLKSICETRLDSITSPAGVRIVIVRGERDRVASRQSLQRAALQLQATYFEIKQSGHTPMLESPSEYNQIVLDLLHAPVGGESEWTEQRLHSKA